MIKIDRLHVLYSGKIIGLKPISLELHRKEFTVLLGPSGAGKSTLLRCLNYLVTPTSGEIKIEGVGALSMSRKLLRAHRRKTGMIFQKHQLIDRFTALKNVMAGFLGNYGTMRSLFPLSQKDTEFALECLDRVGLLDKALTRVDSLSGGQVQRVGIARALAQKPSLVLADEPVASLDPRTAEKVLSYLHRIIKEDGLTAIVSLHQVEYAKKFADRVIGLSQGEVVFDGNALELSDTVLKKIYRSNEK
tara:strand:+ start:1488 stop:2228 length:741 start_codon:yes stop_codon:yes gene_type:complete